MFANAKEFRDHIKGMPREQANEELLKPENAHIRAEMEEKRRSHPVIDRKKGKAIEDPPAEEKPVIKKPRRIDFKHAPPYVPPRQVPTPDPTPEPVPEHVVEPEPVQKPAEVASVTPPDPAPENMDIISLHDLDIVELFLAENKDTVRYCEKTDQWYIFDGTIWEPSVEVGMERRVKDVFRKILKDVENVQGERDRDNARLRARGIATSGKMKSIITLARSEKDLSVDIKMLDAERWLLHLPGVAIDLRTGKAGKPDPKHMVTKFVNIPYDPNATCPRFLQFMHEIMAGDQEMIDYLQRVLGYSLTGETNEQCFFIHYGAVGENGKSTLLSTVFFEMLGEYAKNASIATFLKTSAKFDKVPVDLAKLFGARYVITVEPESGRILSESLIKQLTGEDPVDARFMRCNYFTYLPTFKIHLLTNHRPVIQGIDYAIWRRVRIIPYNVKISEHGERDLDLKRKLIPEYPGILQWAIRGAVEWYKRNLDDPARVIAATRLYQREQGSTHAFYAERCRVVIGASTPYQAIKEAYDAYCLKELEVRPDSMVRLSDTLTRNGHLKRKSMGMMVYQHLELVQGG